MEKLDRTRDFAETWGPGGVIGYSQDGLEFDAAGKARPGQEAQPPKRLGRPPRDAAPVSAPNRPPPVTGHAAMDDETLRGLIEVRGDEWRGRDAAIRTLDEDA